MRKIQGKLQKDISKQNKVVWFKFVVSVEIKSMSSDRPVVCNDLWMTSFMNLSDFWWPEDLVQNSRYRQSHCLTVWKTGNALTTTLCSYRKGFVSTKIFLALILGMFDLGLGRGKTNPDKGTAFNIVPVEPREDVSDWERVIKMSHHMSHSIWVTKYESYMSHKIWVIYYMTH